MTVTIDAVAIAAPIVIPVMAPADNPELEIGRGGLTTTIAEGIDTIAVVPAGIKTAGNVCAVTEMASKEACIVCAPDNVMDTTVYVTSILPDLTDIIFMLSGDVFKLVARAFLT